MTVDTLAFAKHLESAGIDRKFAEAHAEAMSNHVFPQLATKADVEHLVIELRSEMTKGFSDVRREVSELRQMIGDLRTTISDLRTMISDAMVRMTLIVVAVAGLAVTVAKLVM